MPVEKSGEAVFEFEYPDWESHITRFDPDYVKVLVRWNPEGDERDNDLQGRRLAVLSSWLRMHERRLLLELLVPPTDAQLLAVNRSDTMYDTEVRPELACQAMRAIRAAGAEPAVWKVEGVDQASQAQRLSETAQEGGRVDVRCIDSPRTRSRRRPGRPMAARSRPHPGLLRLRDRPIDLGRSSPGMDRGKHHRRAGLRSGRDTIQPLRQRV